MIQLSQNQHIKTIWKPSQDGGLVTINGAVLPQSYIDLNAMYKPHQTIKHALKAIAKRTWKDISELITALKSSITRVKKKEDGSEELNHFREDLVPW